MTQEGLHDWRFHATRNLTNVSENVYDVHETVGLREIIRGALQSSVSKTVQNLEILAVSSVLCGMEFKRVLS